MSRLSGMIKKFKEAAGDFDFPHTRFQILQLDNYMADLRDSTSHKSPDESLRGILGNDEFYDKLMKAATDVERLKLVVDVLEKEIEKFDLGKDGAYEEGEILRIKSLVRRYEAGREETDREKEVKDKTKFQADAETDLGKTIAAVSKDMK